MDAPRSRRAARREAAPQHFDMAPPSRTPASPRCHVRPVAPDRGLRPTRTWRNELVLVARAGAWSRSSCAIVVRRCRLAASAPVMASRAARKRDAASRAQATEPVHGARRAPCQRVSRFAVIRSSSASPSPSRLIVVLVQGGLTSRANGSTLGIQILIYVMLGWGLNIVVGLAGLLDLGYVAFYAVGAYSYALLGDHISACRSGSACRSPASSPPSGASCSASRCCGCAATIWRS